MVRQGAGMPQADRPRTDAKRAASSVTVSRPSSTLQDPYTGTTIAFRRGQDTSDDVQIDHVVALSNAWQTGAQQLDPAARELFGNDPFNLQATDGPANQDKGDADAATWLPPYRATWCPYVARQVAVKAKYGLWVTRAEHDAIARVLTSCPSEPLPANRRRLGPGYGQPPPGGIEVALGRRPGCRFCR